MDTACVMIAYHPDAKVLTNLRAYESFPGSVYVIDNSEGQPDAVARQIGALPGVKYFRDGVNSGVGARLNQACQLALSEGAEWILTMDQDSYFDPALLRSYMNCAASFPGKAEVAMFGVAYGDTSMDADKCQPVAIHQLITSGSLINLSLFSRIGPFDETLFIDGVDTDYCLKARMAGYRLICFGNIVLDHRIGLVSQHRSLKSGALTPRSLHSPVRLYYMTRNYLYLRKKYKAVFPVDLAEHRKDVLVRIKNNLLYNKQRGAVLRYIVKGIWAYYRGDRNKLS
jgi:rhamnosyltransferase